MVIYIQPGIVPQESGRSGQTYAFHEFTRSLAGERIEQAMEVEAAETRGIGHPGRVKVPPAICVSKIDRLVDARFELFAQIFGS